MRTLSRLIIPIRSSAVLSYFAHCRSVPCLPALRRAVLCRLVLCRLVLCRLVLCCAVLCCAVVCCVSPAQAQPTATGPIREPDWRSALILRFDPPAHTPAADPSGGYLSAVTRALESGLVASIGADAISVGPLFASGTDPAPGRVSSAIDPSLGSNEDWELLVAAAGRAGVPIIITFPKSSGQGHQPVRIAGASNNPSFDAFVDELPLEELEDIHSLKTLYKSLSERIASARHPIITSSPIPPGSTPLAARVLLLPGAVQFTAPAPGSGSENGELWRLVAAFRRRHPAVGTGEHEDLANNTYSFARTSNDRNVDDAVIVALTASGTTTLNVSRVFADNTLLHDAVTGSTAFVSFGMATFAADASGVMLIEEAR